jgi:hypothetical protein
MRRVQGAVELQKRAPRFDDALMLACADGKRSKCSYGRTAAAPHSGILHFSAWASIECRSSDMVALTVRNVVHNGEVASTFTIRQKKTSKTVQCELSDKSLAVLSRTNCHLCLGPLTKQINKLEHHLGVTVNRRFSRGYTGG